MNKINMINKIICLCIIAASYCSAQSDIYFSSPDSGASVSFEGKTQAGKDMHRLEVRKLAFKDPKKSHSTVTEFACVIYYAGTEYGPSILLQMEAIAPLVRLRSPEIVEIFFSRGVRLRYRQEWQLLGSTAKLVKEEKIEMKDDPRGTKYP